MDEAWLQRVRERAYAIWQREGSPDGSAEQFWLMAEEELLAKGQGPSSGPPEERPDRPRDEAQVDDTIDDSFPARLDQRDRRRRAQGGQDSQAVLTARVRPVPFRQDSCPFRARPTVMGAGVSLA